MESLLDGYRRFRAEEWPASRARYRALAAKGQRPHTLVVACSDSRVDPATVFSAAPGELFVVRNVAALVPPYQPDGGWHGVSAALEFGVRVLRVERIVVLAHAQCGGVNALCSGAPLEAQDFVVPWMTIAASALKTAPSPDAVEAAVVKLTLENLSTFPWIAEAADAGRLELLGFRFDIHDGMLGRLVGAEFLPVT